MVDFEKGAKYVALGFLTIMLIFTSVPKIPKVLGMDKTVVCSNVLVPEYKYNETYGTKSYENNTFILKEKCITVKRPEGTWQTKETVLGFTLLLMFIIIWSLL